MINPLFDHKDGVDTSGAKEDPFSCRHESSSSGPQANWDVSQVPQLLKTTNCKKATN